jgi:DnaK suppressor protein
VTSKTSRPDPAFIERQKSRLTKMRQQILRVRRDLENEEGGAKAEQSGQAREFEDEAQKLTTLELEENLEVAEEGRLAAIERALQKINEGTYGLSDASGAPIPSERLEAYPEALHTLEEQQAREASDASRSQTR